MSLSMKPAEKATGPTSFRVIGAGLPRTGTASLKAALEILGLSPTFHMFEILISVDRGLAWQKAIRNLSAGQSNPAEIAALVEGFNSGVDAPVSDVYAELLEAYPDAKVILTVRDEEAWWRSFSGTVMKALEPAYGFIIYWLPGFWHQRKLVTYLVPMWKKKYGGLGPQMMRGRIEEVKRTVPAEKLLIYEVKEGWEPLCMFLNVPIPAVPYPRINEKEEMVAFIQAKAKEPTTEATGPTQFRVIGAGLPRTGTASLKAALEILGLGPTYHMFEIFESSHRGIAWTRAIKDLRAGKTAEVQAQVAKLVEGYNSGVDAPISDVYAELLEAYPESKVILTHRPAEEWWKSMNNTVLRGLTKTYGFIIFWVPACWHQRKLANNIIPLWKEKYGAFGPEVMPGRIAEVKKRVPADKLLVYQVQEGWEPLCKFLDLPVPSVPFPRVNDKDAVNVFIEANAKKGLLRWAYVLSGVIAVAAVGVAQAERIQKLWK